MRRLVRSILSWLIATLGFLLGALALALLNWLEPDYRMGHPILLLVFGLCLFAGSSAAVRNRRRGAVLVLSCVPPVLASVAMFGWDYSMSYEVLPSAALVTVFGLFWWGTQRLGWPPLLTTGGLVRTIAIPFLLAVVLDIAITLVLTASESTFYSMDGVALTLQPKSPDHAVFTARVLFVGRWLKNYMKGGPYDPDAFPSDPRVGTWAIGLVQEEFWGLPAFGHHFVFLNNYVFWNGETYFIDGKRPYGVLRRLLPIIEVASSLTRPVNDAELDLRMLRQGKPKSGTRLLGAVWDRYHSAWREPPYPRRFLAGMPVTVTGTSTQTVVTTDRSGIYQVDGLPPGSYEVNIQGQNGQILDRGLLAGPTPEPMNVELQSQAVARQDLRVTWTGKILGHVRDETGAPVEASVSLLTTARAWATDYPGLFSSDGYKLVRVPPGRYVVAHNPEGPSEHAPYDFQYYPSGVSINAAKILDMPGGGEITDIDFKVHRLPGRVAQVRAIRPGGKVVSGATVCAVYEHTEKYEPLGLANCSGAADNEESVLIHLYGNSTVRLFAHDEYRTFSRRLEIRASSAPQKMDLVLNSNEP